MRDGVCPSMMCQTYEFQEHLEMDLSTFRYFRVVLETLDKDQDGLTIETKKFLIYFIYEVFLSF